MQRLADGRLCPSWRAYAPDSPVRQPAPVCARPLRSWLRRRQHPSSCTCTAGSRRLDGPARTVRSPHAPSLLARSLVSVGRCDHAVGRNGSSRCRTSSVAAPVQQQATAERTRFGSNDRQNRPCHPAHRVQSTCLDPAFLLGAIGLSVAIRLSSFLLKSLVASPTEMCNSS